MPRILQVLAVCLALMLVGVPKVIAEIVEDDCAEECAGEEGSESCPDQGCTDCSIVCSSCPRAHVVAPNGALWAVPSLHGYLELEPERAERVPSGPPPEGVFHPPRSAG